MTTAVRRQHHTLSDAVIPFRGLWVDIAIIVAGGMAKIVRMAHVLPTAWSLAIRSDPSETRCGGTPDGNP
ncbi:MAG: hypothetical protein O3C10_06225 [Chloroflexi bacterium]|nr:hypothetical protein [Chloroflexota bacterium]